MFQYFTFGYGHERFPGHVRIEAKDAGEAREIMFEKHGPKFALQYDDTSSFDSGSQVERFFYVKDKDGTIIDGYTKAARNALEMAHVCGLETVGEAVANMQHHCMSLFVYTEINTRLNDIQKGLQGWQAQVTVLEILGESHCRQLDEEVQRACNGPDEEQPELVRDLL